MREKKVPFLRVPKIPKNFPNPISLLLKLQHTKESGMEFFHANMAINLHHLFIQETRTTEANIILCIIIKKSGQPIGS